MSPLAVAGASVAYILGLFLVAFLADRRAAQGRPVTGPTVYALSLAVFCTTWTFYGSVGRAATEGIGFLPTYLGPTLVMALGAVVLVKLLRIARAQRSTSIADFIAARYGRSQLLGGLVALIAVVALVPYIALQLKAMSLGFELLTGTGGTGAAPPLLADTGLWVALAMAAFAIVFGTRSIDASEHHPGLVATVAFESLVKLGAFLLLGIAIVWGLFDGPADLFAQALAQPETARLLTVGPALAGGDWVTVLLLSMAAIVCLPRQFQVLVVENTDPAHLSRAIWLFPLYLLLINLFVLPIALAGLLTPAAGTNPDMFVLTLPLVADWQGLALLVFLGGLSAGTGMIIVETVALATMVSNDLVLPLLLRRRSAALSRVQDLGALLLSIRRVAIVGLLLLGWLYVRGAGSAYALVSIGLISFAGVAQFAPALLGGMFWKGATRRGAVAGLTAGTLVWLYTLLLPSFARSGWLPMAFIDLGPFDLEMLRPYALFGLEALSPLAHSLFWSMVANLGLYIGVSLFDRPAKGEAAQATAFVEVFEQPETVADSEFRGPATVADLKALVARFLGPERATALVAGHHPAAQADAALLRRAERLLAGAIGAASARVALASAVTGTDVALTELLSMLDETSHVIEYSRRLEQKSAELEAATRALSTANDRLRELDRLKDEFLSTVTHELRTPLTSIRALSEILHDTPDLEAEQRQEFLATVIRECERLSRLIDDVLDMAKIEAGQVELHIGPVALPDLLRDAVGATGQLYRDRGVSLVWQVPPDLPPALADPDRTIQVAVNLLSNAVKFAPAGSGRVVVSAHRRDGCLEVAVADNGPGIAPVHLEAVFERFRQVGSQKSGKPQGTGLGLAICRKLVEGMGGRIWAESASGAGATFRFTLPVGG